MHINEETGLIEDSPPSEKIDWTAFVLKVAALKCIRPHMGFSDEEEKALHFEFLLQITDDTMQTWLAYNGGFTKIEDEKYVLEADPRLFRFLITGLERLLEYDDYWKVMRAYLQDLLENDSVVGTVEIFEEKIPEHLKEPAFALSLLGSMKSAEALLDDLSVVTLEHGPII